MKIKILSDSHENAEHLRTTLVQAGRTMDVAVGHATSSDPIGAINGTVPDIVVLDAFKPSGLAALEQLTLRYPQVDPIIITSDTSSEFLLQAFRAGVREVLPTGPSAEALQAALARITHKRGVAAGPAADGKILAMTSCKGGSGATFLATNLAWVLATAHGKRVALIDLNLQFGDAAMYVTDQKPASNLALVCQQIHRLDAAFLGSAMIEVAPNFHLLAAPEDPAHATDVKAEHVEAILKVARANYDFVIVDVGRSLDSVSLQPFDMADMIFPVVQLTLPFIREAKRLVAVLISLGYPMSKVGLIVNRHQKSAEISLQDLERTVNAKVFKAVPNCYEEVAASVNQGEPIARLAKNSPVTKALREIAASLDTIQEKNGKGWLSRLFATH
ncbi:pilus assembly protein CpaE [Aromatoleum tolulyticum]|uniref:Pilus assembly protein CpaE n=1 Tax=Aromatoleum tolulyticum TaxID=34027 RepID=A0A1N6N2P8_9RHOO|nr:AAA family ATPase [Aromatoleum tolulyticum]SIP86364.1 pilus assembly protein CpaE [Aromatoleum tolulyticum]